LKIVVLQYFNQTSHIWVKKFLLGVIYVLHLVKLLTCAKFFWDMLKIVNLPYF